MVTMLENIIMSVFSFADREVQITVKF